MTGAARARLFWSTLSHVPRRRILRRVWLTAKRHAMAALQAASGAPRRAVMAAARSAPDVRDELPLPLFAPRAATVVRDGPQTYLQLLGRRQRWAVPCDWHPPQWAEGTWLDKFVLHYMEYLEAFDDPEFCSAVTDWIQANPPFSRGYWRAAWSSYVVSLRSVVWMQQYARRRAALPADVERALRGSLYVQLRFLRRNLETDLGGNHLIKNIKALLWGARFFVGAEAQAWGRDAARLLEREIRHQILTDGTHYERSPAYHCQVLADLLECYRVLEAGAEREPLAARLGAMARALIDLTHPDGRVSLFNDGGLHMAYGPGELLDVYERLTGARPRAREQIELPAAGYFGLRQGDRFLLADCGPVGPDELPAHGHGDILAFEWDVGGRRVIVDAGVSEYRPGRWRAYSRSTAAHNTVTVADADQCEFWESFRVGRRARVLARRCRFEGGAMILEGAHDGYRRLSGAPCHRRRLWTDASRIEVSDRVEGGRGQPVRARLLCHPDCEVTPGDGTVAIELPQLRVLLRTAQRARVEPGWWMPDFGQRRAAHQIVIDYGEAPCSGGFVLEVR